MRYVFTLLAVLMTSQLVSSSPVREKKHVDTQQLQNYIRLQFKHRENEIKSCRLEEYVDDGECKPCDEICGILEAQNCQVKCPRYVLLRYKNDTDSTNHQQNVAFYFLTSVVITLVAIALLVWVRYSKILCCRIRCRTQKNNEVVQEKQGLGNNESRTTDLTASRDSNRESTRIETTLLVQHQGSEMGQGENSGQRARQNSKSNWACRRCFNQVPTTDNHSDDSN